jgi:hypothetical protein
LVTQTQLATQMSGFNFGLSSEKQSVYSKCNPRRPCNTTTYMLQRAFYVHGQ